jgi:FkbM family methyltransferase
MRGSRAGWRRPMPKAKQLSFLLVLLTHYTPTVTAGASEPAPTQIFSLLKLFAPSAEGVTFGNIHGDGMETAFFAVDPRGRTVVDVGLGDCAEVVTAVQQGFVVHAFDARLESIAACRSRFIQNGVPQSQWLEVPPERAGKAWQQKHMQQQQQQQQQQRRLGAAPGFAFLYNVGLSNASGQMRMALDGSSSSFSPSGTGREGVRSVPIRRLDDLIDEDLWLLKLDVQGHEAHVISGAARLFERNVVAHVMTEFDPRLLRENGVRPRQVPDLLQQAGFACFDMRNGDGPRAGPNHTAPFALGKDHPTDIDAYVAALDRNTKRGMKQDEEGRRRPAVWAVRYGSFDDLACVNLRKVWRQPTLQPESKPLAPGASPRTTTRVFTLGGG